MKLALNREVGLSVVFALVAGIWGLLMVMSLKMGVLLGLALAAGFILLRNPSLGWYISLPMLVVVANYIPPYLSAPLIWMTLFGFIGSFWINQWSHYKKVEWSYPALWWGIALWMVWAGICGFLGLNFVNSVKELARYTISFLVLLTYLSWSNTCEQLRRRWYFLLGTITLVALLCIGQFIFQYVTGAWHWNMLGKYPPTTSEMGVFFAAVLPVAFAVHFIDRRIPKWGHYALGVILLFAVYLSESRASFLAAVAGIGTAYFLISPVKRKQTFILCGVLGVATLVMLLWFEPATKDFLLHNVTGRDRLWKAALEAAAQSPITGIGPASWSQWFSSNYLMAEFVMDDLAGNSYVMAPELLRGEAHQLFLTKLAETGWPGFFGLIGLFVLWGRAAWQQFSQLKQRDWMYFATAGSIASMCGLTVLCFFENGPIIGKARGGEVLIVWFIAAIPLMVNRLNAKT